MKMSSSVYVIIPVYNEATVVAGVLKSILAEYDNVICVNDGSTDGSAQAILEAGATLVDHPINLGAGAATQTGIDYALQDPKATYFITMDADGQHSVKDATTMLKYIQKHKVDIVIGSRFLGTVENIGVIKNIFLKAAGRFSDWMSGTKLTDPHIGLRVFNRKFAEELKLTMPDFSHASELVHRISEKNFSYAEVPVTITYSDYSKAKGQSMINAINIGFDVMLHRISKK